MRAIVLILTQSVRDFSKGEIGEAVDQPPMGLFRDQALGPPLMISVLVPSWYFLKLCRKRSASLRELVS